MRRHYKKALEFDIHCRFAEFLCALDEPELGSLLLPAAAKSLSAATRLSKAHRAACSATNCAAITGAGPLARVATLLGAKSAWGHFETLPIGAHRHFCVRNALEPDVSSQDWQAGDEWLRGRRPRRAQLAAIERRPPCPASHARPRSLSVLPLASICCSAALRPQAVNAVCSRSGTDVSTAIGQSGADQHMIDAEQIDGGA
jgi:hypothetical protein